MTENRIFLGMLRPPEPPKTKYVDEKTGETKYADVIVCSCGAHLRFAQGGREHWAAGHFDTPVYATRDEIIDKVAEKIAAKI